MNNLTYTCIYAIGVLLTYKYVLTYFLSEPEYFKDRFGCQAAAILLGIFWMIFWPAALLCPTPDNID